MWPYLRPEELVEIAMNLWDEEENDPIDFSDESDEESEVIEENLYNSDSEQSVDGDDPNETNWEEIKDDDHRFYVGTDNSTIWINKTGAIPSKTREKKIIFAGPARHARNTPTELDAFSIFITDNILDDIVRFTNIYIEKKRSIAEYHRERDSKYTTRAEIKALFGVLFLISVKKGTHANVLELWSTDGTGMMTLRAAFSYKRFLFLMRSIRFGAKREKYDKLAAIRDFYTNFVENCRNNYYPGKFTTIGEMLHPFRGRCGFIQHMPQKPAKYGLKLYALCDSNTSYTWNFEMYCGKQTDGPYVVSNKPTDIVKRLIDRLKNTNRNLTMDNYYTSYPLAQYLLENGITILGTMKKNKVEIPAEFLPHKARKVGSSLFGFKDNITIVSHVPKKNKAVILLSTMHDAREVDPETGKPIILLDYNRTKGGVDTVDQKCASYSTQRMTKRWSLALFFRFLDIAGINAEVIFKANNPEKGEKRKSFLTNLAFGLMEDHMKERASIKTLPRDLQVFLTKYAPEVTPAARNEKRVGPCHACGTHKNNKTTIFCNLCNKFVCKSHSEKLVSCITCIHPPMEED
ncbi:piggyBac transposable element-derived protein 4-like [Sitophilus oryzae]|uniref:PiggyBac transposable element-derived protein 4-like n=1 Tax=Sitophilus oryzae TaxID=7048 RepID=A0A6J2XMW4_SITOR|nr:piggyBac transposable element-derived protein 4-like [Sitophilus oryzae]